MPQLHVLQALIDWLRDHGTSCSDIDRYIVALSKLETDDELLCPKCYCDDPGNPRIEELVEWRDEGQYDMPLFCAHCKTRYMVKNPG